jgi:hypothetical protein
MAVLKFHRKVAASSVLEVIIAMVLITIIFGIAMMIFTNVTRMSLSAKKLRAFALIDSTLQATALPQSGTTTQQIDDFRIELQISTSTAYPDMTEIRATAYDLNQVKITEQAKLIPHMP